MKVIVPLTNEIKEEALYWTFMRNRTKRSEGVKDQRVDMNRGTLFIDYMGMLAEIAVAKNLNCKHLQNEDNILGDEGFDLLYSDIKVQVKYTFHDSGHLLLGKPNSQADLTSDIYILTTGDEKAITIIGYIAKEAITSLMIQKDFGFGMTWCIEQAKLRKFSSFPRLKETTK